jgi:hypothetical protein
MRSCVHCSLVDHSRGESVTSPASCGCPPSMARRRRELEVVRRCRRAPESPPAGWIRCCVSDRRGSGTRENPCGGGRGAGRARRAPRTLPGLRVVPSPRHVQQGNLQRRGGGRAGRVSRCTRQAGRERHGRAACRAGKGCSTSGRAGAPARRRSWEASISDHRLSRRRRGCLSSSSLRASENGRSWDAAAALSARRRCRRVA